MKYNAKCWIAWDTERTLNVINAGNAHSEK